VALFYIYQVQKPYQTNHMRRSQLKDTSRNAGELETVNFFRNQVMFKPEESHFPTIEDSDESKLEALNELLMCLGTFQDELASLGIRPETENSKIKDTLILTDSGYLHYDNFKIRIKCQLLDPDWVYALHAGFSFHLSIEQSLAKGREIADWIDLSIKHIAITPNSLYSCREHVRALAGMFKQPGPLYFAELPLRFDRSVNFGRMAGALSPKTSIFKETVSDACAAMKQITSRKQFLAIHPANK